MSLRINTNVSSLAAQKALGRTIEEQSKILGKLSSGSRIVRAADDAAGLAISDKLRAQIRSMDQAKRNTNDAISLVQIAEGSLEEISNILVRLRELAIQSSSDTIADTERVLTNVEFQSLKKEIQRISVVTDFNGQKLLDGTVPTFEFQVGIYNNAASDRIVYDSKMITSTLKALGITALSIDTKDNAQASLGSLDKAITQVSGKRAELGAVQNRLSSTTRNLENSVENLSAANSRIKDADFAVETANNTRYSILTNSGSAVLNQANNQMTQTVMKLLNF